MGANGLIGSYFSHLLDYLNSEKNFSIEADLITLNSLDERSRIFDLKGKKGLTVIQKDISQSAVYKKDYDYVIHAAGYSAPGNFLADPIRAIDVNYVGLKSVLESVVSGKSKPKILYISSSEIYGSPEAVNVPTPEDYPGNGAVTNSRACYMESKRLSEVLALNYNRIHGTDIKIARICLAYGPGMSFDDKRVVGQFMNKAKSFGKIEMVDDGRDLRSFCYLSDVLKQLLSILLFSKETIYNVGSKEEELTIKDVAFIIGGIFGVEVVPGPGKAGVVADAPSRACVDTGKIEKEFGFKPLVPIKEGLHRTSEWNILRSKND